MTQEFKKPGNGEMRLGPGDTGSGSDVATAVDEPSGFSYLGSAAISALGSYATYSLMSEEAAAGILSAAFPLFGVALAVAVIPTTIVLGTYAIIEGTNLLSSEQQETLDWATNPYGNIAFGTAVVAQIPPEAAEVVGHVGASIGDMYELGTAGLEFYKDPNALTAIQFYGNAPPAQQAISYFGADPSSLGAASNSESGSPAPFDDQNATPGAVETPFYLDNNPDFSSPSSPDFPSFSNLYPGSGDTSSIGVGSYPGSGQTSSIGVGSDGSLASPSAPGYGEVSSPPPMP
jgi:hypothetical protein